MNSVILSGRLTKDTELAYTPQTQKPVCKFTIAVDRFGKDAGVDFIRCTAWNDTAINIDKYFHKGKPIIIEGQIRTGSYEKKGEKVYTTEVVVNRFEFVPQDKESVNVEPTESDLSDTFSQAEDDIPF